MTESDPPGPSRRATSVLTTAMLAVVAAGFACFHLHDFDLGLARVTGRWIVESGAVPTTNVFSAIHHDRPFVDDKWLFHVVCHLVVDGLGATWAGILRVVIVVAIALLALPSGTRPGARSIAVPLSMVALLAASERFAFRPELFSLLFAVVFARILIAERAPTWRGNLFLLLAQVVWTNTHGYFVLGPILAGAAATGAVIDAWRSKAPLRPPARRLLLVPGLVAAGLVNPYGVALLWSPVEILVDLERNFDLYSDTIVEFVPPFAPFDVLPSDLAAYRVLLVVMGLALLAVRRRVRAVELVPLLALLAMSFNLRRNVAAFALVAAPVAAIWIDRGLATMSGGRWARRAAVFGGLIAAPLATAFLFLVTTDRLAVHDRLDRTFGLGWSDVAFPDVEFDYVLDAAPPGVVFTSFSFGSTFVGRGFPDHTPFIDGNTAGYDAGFLRRYADAVKGSIDPHDLAIEFGIDWFVVKPGHVMTQRMLADDRFVPLAVGRHACVIARRAAVDPERVRRDDLRARLESGRFEPSVRTPPSTFLRVRAPTAEITLARLLAGLGRFDDAARACRTALEVNDDLYEVWHALGASLLAAGRVREAEVALDAAVARAPRAAIVRGDRGLVYLQQGNVARAERELEEAIALDGGSAVLWFRYALIGARGGKRSEARQRVERALELDPAFGPAKELRERL